MDDGVGGDIYLPTYVGMDGRKRCQEARQVDVLHYRFLQLGHLAVTVHEDGKSHARVADGPDSLLVGRTLDAWIREICLADAPYGRRGIHYLMGQHTSEALPRLHLALCNEPLYVLPHIVEHFLQGTLAEEQSLGGQPKREIAMADGIVHQPCTVA